MSARRSILFDFILLFSLLNFGYARVVDGSEDMERQTYEYEDQVKVLKASVTLEIDSRLQPIWERLHNAEPNDLPKIVTDFQDIVTELVAVMEIVVEHQYPNAPREDGTIFKSTKFNMITKFFLLSAIVAVCCLAKEIPNFHDPEITPEYIEAVLKMTVMRLMHDFQRIMMPPGSEPGFAATPDDVKTYLLQFISHCRNVLLDLEREMNDEFNDVEYYRSIKNLDNAVAAKR